MTKPSPQRIRLWIGGTLGLLLLAGLTILIVIQLRNQADDPPTARRSSPAAVAVAQIEQGTLIERRTFSGTLNPRSTITISSRIPGQIQQLHTEVGLIVGSNETVITLDEDEYVQAVAEARAEFTVAEAELQRAQQRREVAERELQRNESLRERGIASEARLDEVRAEFQARDADFAVAEARVDRARALLNAAEIRRSRTRIPASWRNDAPRRVVGERFVEEGETIAVGQPLLTVLDIDELRAVISVTEADYERIRVGQSAVLHVDAHPGRDFPAEVLRKAPLFRTESRQADIELRVPNPDHRLRPGMFARVDIDLDQIEDAAIVPIDALVRRNGKDVVFAVDEDEMTVRMVPIRVRLQTETHAAVEADDLAGRVVVLGQQLLRDGSNIRIPADERDASEPLRTQGNTGGRS